MTGISNTDTTCQTGFLVSGRSLAGCSLAVATVMSVAVKGKSSEIKRVYKLKRELIFSR